MALRFYNVIGKMTIKQKENKFNIKIYDGNALAVFNYEYKNQEGEDMIGLYDFFADKAHVKNIIKNTGRLFRDDVTSIELNLAYPASTPLLNILVKNGYKVKAYYKEIKK